jgi:Zn-dependent peptidase ImmA (M78 family)
MSRDFQYREDSARLHAPDKGWLAELPLGDMIRFGWLQPVPKASEETAACLRFFNVPSVGAWRAKYASVQAMAAFRTSRSFESRPAAVAAWLRKAEIEGEAVSCARWNPSGFENALTSIRRLTRYKDPDRFLPELSELCSTNGVALAIVRPPNGCRASGATKFLSPQKALLVLSFRHLTDDQFWFTFFHESGHLLLHSNQSMFIEGVDTSQTKEENEANDFAEHALIPAEHIYAMLSLRLDSVEVIKFARKIGISPGLVVGQLQHHKRIRPNQLNGLKRRFAWEK